MARHLYVYYQVQAAALTTTLPTVRAMQARLRAAMPSLQTGLLRRPELRDGQATLMETYSAAGGAAAARHDQLADAVADAALRGGLPQPRHVEWFDDLEAP